jgi:hypothetical protein
MVHKDLWQMFGGEIMYINSTGRYEDFTLEVGESKQLPYSVDHLKFLPHAIMVYSNIGQEQSVGSAMHPLLRLLQFKQPTEDFSIGQVTLESKHLLYMPVSHSIITSIEIKLMTTEGRYIDYVNQKDRVVAVVKFRRKNRRR